jgi:hypothetical protein
MTNDRPGKSDMRLDIDKVSATFERIDKALGSNPDSRKMRDAALAVYFVWGNGHIHNFEDLLACFHQGMPLEETTSFDTREQAHAWLKHAQDNQQEHCLSIAGKPYTPSYSLDQGDIEFIRVPTRHELTSTLHNTGLITDGIAAALQRIATQLTVPDEMDALLTALLALHFILETGQVSGFEHYLSIADMDVRVVKDPPLRSFGTRSEADAWLKAHPRPPAGARVHISGQKFLVSYDRESGLRRLFRPPTLEELGLTDS